MSDKKEIEVKYEVDGIEIKLTPSIVQNYIVGSDSKITMQEFKFFTELCKARKLNPFLKEAYCIKYGSAPAQIVVGKDVFVKRAAKNPRYNGKETGIIVLGEDGNTIERKGCFSLPNEIIVGGWARVHVKDREFPEYMSVSLSEVVGKKRDGTFNSNWQTKPATMVEKVAKVRALREAFVEEFEGMYIQEEFALENAPVQENVQEVADEVLNLSDIDEE